MSDQVQRDNNLKRLQTVIEKMSTGRSAETVDDITEDFEFELPYGPGRAPINIKGKEQWGQLNSFTWSQFDGFGLTVTKVHEMRSADKLIAEYVSDGSIIATGKPYKNRYIGVFAFRDGLISSWTEFHNPEITSEAMTADAPADAAS